MISSQLAVTWLKAVTIIGGLLITACSAHMNVDFDYQGRDDDFGIGPVTESGILFFVIISFVGLFGLMLALGRRRRHR